MAEPHDFEGSTHRFGPPPGMEELVGWLHVFSNQRCVVSAWKPTAEELERLNAGESIFISVTSGSTNFQLPDGEGGFKIINKPNVFPTFVGTEALVRGVVADMGATWGETSPRHDDPG